MRLPWRRVLGRKLGLRVGLASRDGRPRRCDRSGIGIGIAGRNGGCCEGRPIGRVMGGREGCGRAEKGSEQSKLHVVVEGRGLYGVHRDRESCESRTRCCGWRWRPEAAFLYTTTCKGKGTATKARTAATSCDLEWRWLEYYSHDASYRKEGTLI